MSVRDPVLIIFSDASLLGWGASLNDASARGPSGSFSPHKGDGADGGFIRIEIFY